MYSCVCVCVCVCVYVCGVCVCVCVCVVTAIDESTIKRFNHSDSPIIIHLNNETMENKPHLSPSPSLSTPSEHSAAAGAPTGVGLRAATASALAASAVVDTTNKYRMRDTAQTQVGMSVCQASKNTQDGFEDGAVCKFCNPR